MFTSRLSQAEKRINTLKDIWVQKSELNHGEEDSIENAEKRIRDIQNLVKRYNMLVIRDPYGEEKENGAEALFEENWWKKVKYKYELQEWKLQRKKHTYTHHSKIDKNKSQRKKS